MPVLNLRKLALVLILLAMFNTAPCKVNKIFISLLRISKKWRYLLEQCSCLHRS